MEFLGENTGSGIFGGGSSAAGWSGSFRVQKTGVS